MNEMDMEQKYYDIRTEELKGFFLKLKLWIGDWADYKGFLNECGFRVYCDGDIINDNIGFKFEIRDNGNTTTSAFVNDKGEQYNPANLSVKSQEKEINDRIKRVEDYISSQIYSNNNKLRDAVNKYWINNTNEFFKIISELYSPKDRKQILELNKAFSHFNDNPLRFLSELIQNADDCIYNDKKKKDLTIRIYNGDEKKVELEYPERGFYYDDIISLSGFNISNKKKDKNRVLNTIGEKGRGFKSTFVYFKQVNIYSRQYSFSYFTDDSISAPTYINETYKAGTKLTLFLNVESMLKHNKDENVEISADDCIRKLWKSVKKAYGTEDLRELYANNPVFFTRNINKLTLEYIDETNPDKQKETIVITNDHYLIDGNGNRIADSAVWWKKPEDVEDYCKCKGSMTLEVPGKSKQTIHLEGIVKYLDIDEGGDYIDENRFPDCSGKDISDNMPIIMMGISNYRELEENTLWCGHMYTYLPTSMNINMPFVFQLPFDLEDNRSCPKANNAWNKFLLKNLWGSADAEVPVENTLIAQWYDSVLKKHSDWNVFNYLPVPEDGVLIKTLKDESEDSFGFNELNQYRGQANVNIEKFNENYCKLVKDLYKKKLEIFECYTKNKETNSVKEYSCWDNIYVVDEILAKFDIEYTEKDENEEECKAILNPYWDGFVENEKKKERDAKRFRYTTSDSEWIDVKNRIEAFTGFVDRTGVDKTWVDLRTFRKRPSDGVYNKTFSGEFRKRFLDNETWKKVIPKEGSELNKFKTNLKEAANGILVLPVYIYGEDEEKRWSYQHNVSWFVNTKPNVKEKTLYVQKKMDENKWNPIIDKCVVVYNLEDAYKDSNIVGYLMDNLSEMPNKIDAEKLLNYYIYKYQNIKFKKAADELIAIGRVEGGSKWDEFEDFEAYCESLPILIKENNGDYPYQLLTYFVCKLYLDRKNSDDLGLCLDFVSRDLLKLLGAKAKHEKAYVVEEKNIVCKWFIDNEVKDIKPVSREYFQEYSKLCEEKCEVVFCPDDKWHINQDILIFKNENKTTVILKGNNPEELLLQVADYCIQDFPEENLQNTIKDCLYTDDPLEAFNNKPGSGNYELIIEKLKQKEGIVDLIKTLRIQDIILKKAINNKTDREQFGDGNREAVLNELLQNISDQMGEEKSVEFIINDKHVSIAYKEKSGGFMPKDIAAISGVRMSTKRADGEGTIGQYGLGFKNVYSLFDKVRIYSNGFGFEFDKCVCLDFSKCEDDDISGKFITNQSIETNLNNFGKYSYRCKPNEWEYYPIPTWIGNDNKKAKDGATHIELYGEEESIKLFIKQLDAIEDKILFLDKCERIIIKDKRSKK